MPRDGTGNYTKPFPDVVTNTTIGSTMFNGTINDLATDANTARPVVAGGTGGATASIARANLRTEVSMQVVTNYDAQVWEAGSFYSAAGATSAPTANANAGVAIVVDSNNVILKATDQTTGLTWVRRKTGGSWGSWGADASDKLPLAGGTLTGDLIINKANPSLILTKQLDAEQNLIWGKKVVAGVPTNRWVISLGDNSTESGSNVGDDFAVYRYNDAGAITGTPFSIRRSDGLATHTGNVTITGNETLTGNLQMSDNYATGKIAIGTLGHQIGRDPADGSMLIGGGQGVIKSPTDITIQKTTAAPAWLHLSTNASGQARIVTGETNGALRWSMQYGTATAESGGNAGSDFALYRYPDSPSGPLDASGTFTINRATGNAAFAQALGVGNGINVTAGGLTVTGNTTLNNAVTINSTLNTSGAVVAPSFSQTGSVFTINGGQFHYNGSAYFVYLSGVYQVVWNAGNCPAVFGTNRYQKFANGLIMQWGTASGGGAASFVVTMPVAFPNQFFGVICAAQGDPGPNMLAPSSQPPNNAQIVFYPRYVLSGGTVGYATQSVQWVAFGF